MPRIAITTSSFDVKSARRLGELEAAGFEIVSNPFGRRLTEAEAGSLLARDVVGVIAGVEPLTRGVLEAAQSLRIISRCGIGLDNVDLDAAREQGIRVVNTPDAPAAAVAELAIGLILDALRRISEADRSLRAGAWKPLMGKLLGAQTVGVVGYGRVGRRVARLADAFGARVLAYDILGVPAGEGVEPTSLDELLAAADVVTLHFPSTVENHHVIDRKRLAGMKQGAFLVNTARGGLVDETALAELLREGHLAGAAFDVFEHEPYDGPLKELENVVLTAHMGSYARESRSRQELESVANLCEGMKMLGLLR